jgi:ribosomal protein S10
MDFGAELVKQGPLGLFTAFVLWLYIKEVKDHKETRQKYEDSIDARRVDAKDVTTNLVEPIRGISAGIQALSDKIQFVKGRR